MVVILVTSIFVILVLILGFMVKNILYVDSHEASIAHELHIFNSNFNDIQKIDQALDFNLGSGHMYDSTNKQ